MLALFNKLVAQILGLKLPKALDLQKLSHESNLKGSRASLKQEAVFRDNHSQNIYDRL